MSIVNCSHLVALLALCMACLKYINLIIQPDLRPILSAIGTYNYKIAKFLVPNLQPLTLGPCTVKDSFVKEITSFHNDSDCVMTSFDVDSLFTNAPLTERVNLCCDLLFRDSDLIV